jgi:hypothetical protein
VAGGNNSFRYRFTAVCRLTLRLVQFSGARYLSLPSFGGHRGGAVCSFSIGPNRTLISTLISRLLYVACTRAQGLLYLTYAVKRKIAGVEKPRELSGFVSSVLKKNPVYSNPSFRSPIIDPISTMVSSSLRRKYRSCRRIK